MKAIDICMLILYLATLLDSFTFGFSFVIDPQGLKKKINFINVQSSGRKMKESLQAKSDTKAQTLGGK